MKKLIFLILLIILKMFSQRYNQDKFIIGADWLNPTEPSPTHTFYYLSENYWDLIKSFGLNYGAFNIGELVVNRDIKIATELGKANSRGIKIFLNAGLGEYFNAGRRWLYQAEDYYDFNFHGNIVGISDIDINIPPNKAEPHWSQININEDVPNYWRLTVGEHNAGIACSSIISSRRNEIPNATTIYLKIKAKLPQTVTGDNLPVLRIDFTANNTTISKYVNFSQLTTNWQEITICSLDVTANGIQETTIPLIGTILNDTLGIHQIQDYLTTEQVNANIDMSIYWYGNYSCDIDYITIDDFNSHQLYSGQYDTVLQNYVNNYQNLDGLGNIKVWDEPNYENFLPIRYLKRKISTNLIPLNKNKTALSFNNGRNPQRYLAETDLDIQLSDIYPLALSIPTPLQSNYLIPFQDRINENFIYYINDESSVSNRFKVPFWFTPQAHKLIDINNPPGDLREPSGYEIKSMVNLSVCYGAKGIHYFMFSEVPYNVTGFTLLDSDDINNPIPRYYDEYGYPKWETIKQLNQKLATIGDELISLIWRKAFSIHLQPSLQNEIISEVKSFYTPQENNLDPPDATYVEIGLFKKTTEINNENLEYFYTVNRRTLPDDVRHIRLKINKSSSQFNNWKVTEVGTSNVWTIAKDGIFITSYQPGEGKLFKLEPVMIGGGSLILNETINANITINGTVTVPQGITLTISSGKSLTFQNSSSLKTYGTLNANASNSNSIVFDFVAPYYSEPDQNGMKLYYGSTANIINCNIKNAYQGIFADKSNLTLQNSTIENCNDGLYLFDYNTYCENTCPLLLSNIIRNNTNAGINLNNSSPVLMENEISNNSIGVNCINSSNAKFGNVNVFGYNILPQNEIGVFSYLSSPIIGFIGNPFICSYNAIWGQTYNVIADFNSFVWAEDNYWGESNPNPNKFLEINDGKVDFVPWLVEWTLGGQWNPVNNHQQKSNSIAKIGNQFEVTDDPILINQLKNAIKDLLNNKNKNKAIKMLKDIVKDYPDSSFSFIALSLLHKISRTNSEKDSLKQFLNHTINVNNQKNISAYSNLIKADIEKTNYINKIDEVISSYSNSSILPFAYFKKFIYYNYETKNDTSAKQVYLVMKELFPTSNLTKEVKHLLGLSSIQKQNPEIVKTQIPAEYSFSQNYPNPFNPVTNIRFSVISRHYTTLKIFDILGKEVATLVNEIKDAGEYEVEFNAANLASGIYFYELKSGDFRAIRKLMLLK